jgi:long-chain acyl-CoA synthetase
MAIAAALPLSRARHVYWAGDIVRLFYSRLTQIFCRAVHLFPVDERYPDAGVATAVQVLRSGQVQVWFPEGWRSSDGNLQRFLPGIGQLLLRTGSPAVPAWVEGAFEALPRGRRIPRFIVSAFASGLSSMLNSWPTKGPARPMMSTSPMACALASSHWGGRFERS